MRQRQPRGGAVLPSCETTHLSFRWIPPHCSMIRPWLELARISNLPTVWTNVTGAWLLNGGALADWCLGWLLLAGSLLYSGGMVLNDAADLKYDREHRKERPIPSGKVKSGMAWLAGLAMLGWGASFARQQGGADEWTVIWLVLAILFYDLYHKPWPGAVWVMGACRVLLCLMAASAAVGAGWLGHNPQVLVCAGALGAYIVGLTMVARMEGKGGPSSKLAAFFAKGLLYMPGIAAVAWLVNPVHFKKVVILGDLQPLAPLVLIFIFAAMVARATRLMRQGGAEIGRAVGILLAGIAVVDALAVMRVSLPLAVGFVVLAPILRLWQRWIAAT